MHAAGHQIIPGSLRRTLNQGRCLNLKESLRCQKCPGKGSHLASNHKIFLDIRSSQIQETVLQAQLFLCLAVLLNGEGRCLGLGKNAHGVSPDLNGACGQVGIYRAGAGLHPSCNGNYKLAPQLFRLCEVLCAAVIFLKYNLKDAGAVPQIHKDDAALVPALLNPSHDGHFLTDMGSGHFRTSMGTL